VVLALVAGLVMGFLVAPRDAAQGNVQRIMYVHVPSVLWRTSRSPSSSSHRSST